MEFAGGEPVFPRLREEQSATGRIVTPAQVVAANPDVIIASWCGRKVSKEQIRARENWSRIQAVRAGDIYEIKSTYILQPGPAALTEGVRQLHTILARVARGEPAPGLRTAGEHGPGPDRAAADLSAGYVIRPGSLPAVLASCSTSTICRNSRDFTSYRCGPRVMYRT